MDISQYPKYIRDRVTIETVAYGGTCAASSSMTYHITCNEYTLHHEMGHAAAKIMGIEHELGMLIWDTPGCDVITNDNFFCYGAQRRKWHDSRRAVVEYAADAIRAYVLNVPQLPAEVRELIEAHWTKVSQYYENTGD